MNIRIEDHSDDFERELGAFSVAPPSSDYRNLARRLEKHKVGGWAWHWRNVTSVVILALVIVTGTVQLLRVSSQSQLPAGGIEPGAPVPLASVEDGVHTDGSGPAGQIQYLPGTHYRELTTPVPPDDPSVAQVLFFFSYPCHPCFQFNGILADWQGFSTENVELTLVPVTWSDELRYFAQVFYTAQALGVQEQGQDRIYQAIHEQRADLEDLPVLVALFNDLGVSRQAFIATFYSDAVRTNVEQAARANSDYQVRATPSLYVNGQFLVTPRPDQNQQVMLEVADYLLQLQ